MPKGAAGKVVETKDPEAALRRRMVYKLIVGRFKAGYDQGYRDATDGKPPSASYAEGVWDSLMELEQGAKERFGPGDNRHG